jgi:hypothetical protein
MCNRTSPFPGAYTGASSTFKLWSAVTIKDGFGSGVDMDCRATPFVPFTLFDEVLVRFASNPALSRAVDGDISQDNLMRKLPQIIHIWPTNALGSA